MEDKKKRDEWFQGPSNNILQHSELDHIFNNKLNKIYDLEDIKGHNLPKPDIELNGSFIDEMKPKKQHFMIKQRSKPSVKDKSLSTERKNNSQINDGALARRAKAKNTL